MCCSLDGATPISTLHLARLSAGLPIVVVSNYLSHATSLFVASLQISQDFSTLIEDPEREALNEYTDTSVSMRQEHQGLAHEQVPKLQHSFSTTLLSEIDAECVRNSELAKRVQRRIEVFSEMGSDRSTCHSRLIASIERRHARSGSPRLLPVPSGALGCRWPVLAAARVLPPSRCRSSPCLLRLIAGACAHRCRWFMCVPVSCVPSYYQKKVNELREERSARANKGKTESASDIDKFERNQKKLAESEVMFHEINSKLLQDLRELWSVERIARMGPLLQRFLAHERKFAELYTQALAQVKDKTAFVTP
jgi:hypothetical protein